MLGNCADKMVQIVERRSAILNLPEEIVIGQYSDHRDIVRFTSLQDRNFRPVLSRLSKFGEDINKQFSVQASTSEDPAISPAKGMSAAMF